MLINKLTNTSLTNVVIWLSVFLGVYLIVYFIFYYFCFLKIFLYIFFFFRVPCVRTYDK